MRVLVTGSGRGGTCLIRAVVDKLNIVEHYQQIREDGKFFEYEKLPENYGTKLNAENKGYNLLNLIEMMQKYDDLYIIFSFRNPIDQCMSKIVRGQKRSKGGDGSNKIPPDGTVEGAISALKYAHHIHGEIIKRFPNRTHTVMMENVILNPEKEVNKIATFFGVDVTKEALEFYKYNTNPRQRKRYGDRLDKSQIDIYKRWQTAYNGYFKDRKKDIDTIREAFNVEKGGLKWQ